MPGSRVMSEEDRTYYRRRAAEEEMAAKQAADAAAANAHRTLAGYYSALISDRRGTPPTS